MCSYVFILGGLLSGQIGGFKLQIEGYDVIELGLNNNVVLGQTKFFNRTPFGQKARLYCIIADLSS